MNKTVIITGSSSGMGKYMAQKFADEGLNVVLTGRTEGKLQTTKEELDQTAKGDILIVPMDVRKPEDVDGWYHRRLTILVELIIWSIMLQAILFALQKIYL